MKNLTKGIVLSAVLLTGVAYNHVPAVQAETATTTTTINNNSVADENLSQYTNSEDYKIENGVIYFKNEAGEFVKPSTKYIKNSTLLNVTKNLLDKDRYTYVTYERDGSVDKVSITFANSNMGATMGYSPFTYQFNTNKRVKGEHINNVRTLLVLDYVLYDSITKKFNSSIYQTKLKYSLIDMFGKKDGEAIYTQVNTLRKKYTNINIDPAKPVHVYKKIGKIGVYSTMDSNSMYVEFSY